MSEADQQMNGDSQKDPLKIGLDQKQLLVDRALYTAFDISDLSEEDQTKLLLGGGTLDAFCANCGVASVFTIKSQIPTFGKPETKAPITGDVVVSSVCSRNRDLSYLGCDGTLLVILFKDYHTITKIGQFPSSADLAFASLDPVFDKELDTGLRRELGRAIGLHAHGVGIGSFVYLRRIFETLLEHAHVEAAKGDRWDEQAYREARVPEKIKAVQKYLPSRLTESADLYGILSRGIHELSEDDCRDAFDLVKQSILMILRQRAEDKKHQDISRDLQRKIQKRSRPG